MIDFENSPKRATNLSLNAKVLDAARELGLNLSQVVDGLLLEEVRRRYREKWLADNRESIAEYNLRVAREGAFSDGLRKF